MTNAVTSPIKRINLITTCTKGKHLHSPFTLPQLDVNENDDVHYLLYRWREKLNLSIKYGNPLPAEQVYRGTHWDTARQIVCNNPEVDLWVISAGLGLLHASESIVPYEASFNSLPISGSSWWAALTEGFQEGRTAASIQKLMQARPHEIFVIAGSPTYIAAVEKDIMAGSKALNDAVTQLVIVTSAGYKGHLEGYITRSHAGMMNTLNSNMVCLNIKHARSIIANIRGQKRNANFAHAQNV